MHLEKSIKQLKPMKKVILFVFVCLAAMTNLNAQEATESLLVKSNWRINILPLNVGYEHQIGTKSTIYATAGISLGSYGDSTNVIDRVVLPFLSLTGQYRSFYNLEKRQEKGKSIFMNSGNFIGGQINFMPPPLSNPNNESTKGQTGVVLGPVWGAQRNKVGRFSFVFAIGPAVAFTSEGAELTTIGQLSFGVLLGNMGK